MKNIVPIFTIVIAIITVALTLGCRLGPEPQEVPPQEDDAFTSASDTPAPSTIPEETEGSDIEAEPTPTPEPDPAPTPESIPEVTPAATPDNITLGDLEVARQVIYEYWAAFNSYDVEKALSYYEENYREQEREDVEYDISRIRKFGVTLTVENVSEPVIISEGKVEIQIDLGTPIGNRHLLYELIQVDGEWKICLESSIEKLLKAKEFIIGYLTEYGESQLTDMKIMAEQRGIKRAVLDSALSDLVKLGEVVEIQRGIYSLPNG